MADTGPSTTFKWPKFPTPFQSGSYGDGAQPKTLRELEMIKLSSAIRRKPQWFEKMKNPEIVAKWKEEAKAEGFTENQIGYVIQELQYYDSLKDAVTGIQRSDVDGVWDSDTMIEESLRQELLTEVSYLEDIPESKRDWHPGSDKKVWNLVHPSVYPVMYGKTRVVPDAVPALKYSGAGEIIKYTPPRIRLPTPAPAMELEDKDHKPEENHESADEQSENEHESDHDQDAEGVLNDEIEMENEDDDEDEDIEPHDDPEPVQFFPVVVHEPMMEPMEGGVSSDDDDASGNGNPRDYHTSKKFTWLPTDFVVNEDGTVKAVSYINNLHPEQHRPMYRTLEKILAKFVPLFEKVLEDQVNPRPNRIAVTDPWYANDSYPGNDSDSDYSDNYRTWEENRTVILPDAPTQFVAPVPVKDSGRIKLAGKTVQVIVKLANIVLTPQNPKYFGGVWHVEGMQNESIVASGIYYYDVVNTTGSELAFRHTIREPDYDQYDDRGVREVYGLQDNQGLNQFLGSVSTTQGRCLGFPNHYQHQVQPFQLADVTKPGHRKILVFFLVDPGTPIVSTTTVPPQQLDWYMEQLLKIQPFRDLPFEIVENIVKFLDWPISLEVAKNLRMKLMKERKFFVSHNNEEYFERPFSLCEH